MPPPTPPPRYRTARVVAGDVRPGDDIEHEGAWRYVSTVTPDGDRVKIDLLSEVLSYDRTAPVLVRWLVPITTGGMARAVRR